MSARFTQGQILEVPLPSDYQDQACLPIVIMQPTANATNYMLKSTYATNGQPGVVDAAIIANTVKILPQHGPTHLQEGTDPIPLSSGTSDGLCPAGDGSPGSYLGGDRQNHPLPAYTYTRSEMPITFGAGASTGAVLASSVVPNVLPGIYMVQQPYLYNWNKNFPAAGTIHYEVWSPISAAWIAVTSPTDVSQFTADISLVNPILLSIALTRVFTAAPNAFTWRVVVDTPGGVTCYFQAGFSFLVAALTALQS